MTKVKLSKRLHTIANMVDKGAVLADIGCDHALLDIFLIQNGLINKAYACDVKQGALNQAQNNVASSKVKNVELRLGDGLSVLTLKDKVDTIVISGLGNQKITSILKENTALLNTIDRVIIQSNTKPGTVRKTMVNLGYYVKDETLVEENNIIYIIIKFVKGEKKYSKLELTYGPIILKQNNPLFNKLIDDKINSYKRILPKLSNKNVLKKICILSQIRKLGKLKK